MRTTPSISARRRLSAPPHSGRHLVHQHLDVLPTWRFRRFALISAAGRMSRIRVPRGTSSGSAPDSSFAFAPSTGEYAKQADAVELGFLEKVDSSRNSSSVSPGIPAMRCCGS